MSAETGTGKRVTLRDIARRLDVSHATVSRALNAKPDALISEATRVRIRNLASEMGYRPNHAARSLATGRTGLFALWLWTERMQGAYHATVVRLMHEAARSHRHQLLIDLLAREEGIEPTVGFDRWQVDGIVAWESGPVVEAMLQGGSPVPLVSVGSYGLLEGVDQVRIDLREGVYAAIRHLIDGGRRQIVYVTDDLPNRGGEARFETYREAMLEAGLEPSYLEVAPSRRAARKAIRDLLGTRGVPDALFCHNDDLALGAYRGLCDLGVKVPDDVAIVGCDGIEDGEYLETPLTTVAQPLVQASEMACRFLERRLQEPDLPPQSAIVRAELIVRESTLMSS